MHPKLRPILIAAVALSLPLATCSNGASTDSPTTSSSLVPSSTTTAVTTTQPPTSPPSTAPATTTIAPSTAPTTAPTTTPTTAKPLAGEPIEVGPAKGDVLGVVGVAFDDVLNVRKAPGTDQPVITTLQPTAHNVVATGEAWKLPRSIWFEITANGVTGWAGSSFLAYLGPVDDATAGIISLLGETPTAPTMTALADLIVREVASVDPSSRITTTVAPARGDLGEITVDVVGLGDDSVLGVRLHIFGTPVEAGFTLKSVEQTMLCARGGSADGICV